jgi:hypothetical protein
VFTIYHKLQTFPYRYRQRAIYTDIPGGGRVYAQSRQCNTGTTGITGYRRGPCGLKWSKQFLFGAPTQPRAGVRYRTHQLPLAVQVIL